MARVMGRPAPEPFCMILSRPATALAALLALSLPAAATDIGSLTDSEREAFRAEVREYLLENPEVLMEAIGVLEQRQAQAEAANDAALLQTHAAEIFSDPDSWVGGNPEGDITVVEFTDYRCGYCRKAYEEVAELIESDGNIRFVVKEYPILGEQSLISSRFAVAVRQVAGDAAYQKAHDALITLRGDATPETLGRLAQDMGLDRDAILTRMDSPEVTAVIEANHKLGEALRINGTPTFVIDGTMLRGYVPLEGMRQIVAEQRAG
jgi:protein-disulfide isomerase